MQFLTHKAVRRCSSCSFKLILLNCCIQLQLAEFTAAHPGWVRNHQKCIEWIGDNLQNLDTVTNPTTSHQAGHNLRVLMQIDFSLLARNTATLKYIFIICFKGSQIEPTCCFQWVRRTLLNPCKIFCSLSY